MKKKIKIMIAGGCGFIGSSLAQFFLSKYLKSKIYVLDNLIRLGSELNLNRLHNDRLIFIKGDLSNKTTFSNLPICDVFIDAAADPSVLSGIKSPISKLINNNFISSLNAIEWCAKTKCKFLFLSTSRVYPIKKLDKISFVESSTRFEWMENQDIKGLSNEGINESFDMNGYRSLYGSSKYSSELFIHEYGKYKNLNYIINRCGVVAGPWQMGKIDQGVITYWLSSHIYKTKLKYIGYSGSGKQVRDILHINDLCDLIDKQIDNWSKIDSQVFNIGGGKKNSLSLLELTELVNQITGIKLPISKDNNKRSGDIRIFITDNKKIENILGWKPILSAEKIVIDTFKWIINNKNELKEILK
tara:strand:+ start:6728 stop:7801 length:1074 start_codon:yes stop_codon:yes gene_type:complete